MITRYNSCLVCHLSALSVNKLSAAVWKVFCLNRDNRKMLNSENIQKLPAFVDLHVHFREPGFSYKETIATGSKAAAAGGYSDVFTMPNLNPVPDCIENLNIQKRIIADTACINVHPYASITVGQKGGGELVDFGSMAGLVAGFSDDGRGVQSEQLMREAMKRCREAGSVIVAHCEVDSLLRGGYIHEGEYAAAHNHRGICSESEWDEIERDLRLVEETGCRFHICHVSTKESVNLIRQAKLKGLPVTCETAPHYLLLNDTMLQESGCWKMNPPIRSKEDQEALTEGIKDGTIDCIATDHAPHSQEEKNRGLEHSAFGIVGLETAFPLLYTYLVKKGVITLERLTELMSGAPRKIMQLPEDKDSYTVFDLSEKYVIDPQKFFSKGKATPFAGWTVQGRCLKTVCKGRKVYDRSEEFE